MYPQLFIKSHMSILDVGLVSAVLKPYKSPKNLSKVFLLFGQDNLSRVSETLFPLESGQTGQILRFQHTTSKFQNNPPTPDVRSESNELYFLQPLNLHVINLKIHRAS